MARIKFNTSGAIKIVTRSTRDGIEDIMQEVFDESQMQVPELTTDLKRSGRLNKFGKSMTITYDTPYAAEQHENLSFKHKPGKKAKYLEDPFNDIVPGAVKRFGRKLKEMLGRMK